MWRAAAAHVQSEFYERSDLMTCTMIIDFNLSYTHYQAEEPGQLFHS